MKKKILQSIAVLTIILVGGFLGVRSSCAQNAIERVSVSSDGTQTQWNHGSAQPTMSADGRYIAFSSYDLGLVSGYTGRTNNGKDVFVHDRQTGETSRVSVASDGTPGNYDSDYSAISSDGRYVAFSSAASDLVSGDTNNARDVFVHDRQTSETSRVSVASDGTPGNSGSAIPSISSDGRFIAFSSAASNLVFSDTNDKTDVFVHDRQTGETSRVSIASDGTQGNREIKDESLSISSDGRYIAFSSSASNLVPGDINNACDVFVHDRQTSETSRVSIASDGTQGNNGSTYPAISSDGRYVVFASYASNLVSGDTNGNGTEDVFVHDRQTGETSRVSLASDGTQGNGFSYYPAISSDGRYVAFSSSASNLVSGDTNGSFSSMDDVFVHDRQTSETSRVSVASDGTQGNNGSTYPAISSDGRYVAFSSSASNLVSGDTNLTSDVFVAENSLFDVTPPPPTQFKLTITLDPENGGIVKGDGVVCTASECTGTYAQGTSVTLEAQANDGYEFKDWDNNSSDNKISVYMNSNYSMKATFFKKERQPALYGLFIGSRKGVKNGDDFRADIAASNMLHAFNNLSRTMNVAYARSIEGDFDTGGITRSEIYSAIKNIKSQIHSGDIFFFYVNAHGGNELLGTETTKTTGDEYLEIAPGGDDESSLTDDELFQMMQGMDDVNKWIIVDACHSGGFWANNNQNDQGDLEKLKNAAFIAAAEEDKLTGYSAEGISALSMALTDGLSLDPENKIKAAKGGDILTMENLYEWAADWKKNCEQKDMCKFIYEMEFGDSISPSEVSNFIANKTDDFKDGVDISKLQDPDTGTEVFPVADGNGPYEGLQGQSVLFDASKSYDEDGTIVSYRWDWNNDGSYDNSSSSPTIEHTWNNPLSEGIVGLQVTDNDGLTSTDKILVNISSKTICSSMEKNKGLDIFDTYKLNSGKNESVTVRLKPDENGEYINGGAAINLWSGLKQFKKEKGTLPLELNAILPKSGWHDLSIFSHGKNGFNGAYCITVESSGDAWKTLEATKNVE